MGEASIVGCAGLECCETEVEMCRGEGIVSSWEICFPNICECYGVLLRDSGPISVSFEEGAERQGVYGLGGVGSEGQCRPVVAM